MGDLRRWAALRVPPARGIDWRYGGPRDRSRRGVRDQARVVPGRPGSSVAVYFVLEDAQAYYLGEQRGPVVIGVRALDDRHGGVPPHRTGAVLHERDEPTGRGPQPHTRSGPGSDVDRRRRRWCRERSRSPSVERGPSRAPTPGRVPGRSDRATSIASSSCARRSPMRSVRSPATRSTSSRCGTRRGLADLVPPNLPDRRVGPATWSGYMAFTHSDDRVAEVRLRRCLAHAVDREAVAGGWPTSAWRAAPGGIVLLALQGHTPEIALRFDPDFSHDRSCRRSVRSRGSTVAVLDDDLPLYSSPCSRPAGQVLGLGRRDEDVDAFGEDTHDAAAAASR